MSWFHNKSGQSFDFTAPFDKNFQVPYEGEGKRCVLIPFPVAVAREVDDGNEVVHDVNPALVEVAPASAVTINVDTRVQPGSQMIVKNTGSVAATVGGASCAAGKVTTLLYDGNGYIALGASEI
jgi:hypothetical protein